MNWKGKELKHFGVLQLAMVDLSTKEEAEAFRNAYRNVCAEADKRLAILTGYLSDDRARRLREWMGLTHPLETAKGLSVLEAFNMGFNSGLMMAPKPKKG